MLEGLRIRWYFTAGVHAALLVSASATCSSDAEYFGPALIFSLCITGNSAPSSSLISKIVQT